MLDQEHKRGMSLFLSEQRVDFHSLQYTRAEWQMKACAHGNPRAFATPQQTADDPRWKSDR